MPTLQVATQYLIGNVHACTTGLLSHGGALLLASFQTTSQNIVRKQSFDHSAGGTSTVPASLHGVHAHAYEVKI